MRFVDKFVAATAGAEVRRPDGFRDGGRADDRPGAADRVEILDRRGGEGRSARSCSAGSAPDSVLAPTVLADVPARRQGHLPRGLRPGDHRGPLRPLGRGLDQVNDSDFGLQAGVFTHDVNRIFQAFSTLEVGGVIVNDFPTLRVDNFPYGGVKDSGFGREGVRYAMEDMSEPRMLVLNLNK